MRIRLFSMEGSLDENRELPGHFLHELYKWALECEFKGLKVDLGGGWVWMTSQMFSFRDICGVLEAICKDIL